MAGNALAGNFYGSFPSGDGLAGGNFVTTISTFHNTILPFVPIADGYVPPKNGIDPPANAKLPKFHQPVAKNSKLVAHKTKASAVQTAGNKTVSKNTTLEAVDAALAESSPTFQGELNGVERGRELVPERGEVRKLVPPAGTTGPLAGSPGFPLMEGFGAIRLESSTNVEGAMD